MGQWQFQTEAHVVLTCSRVRVAIVGLQVKFKFKSTKAFDVVFRYQAHMKLIFTKTPST